MKSDWIKARQTRYAAYATIYILVILAVVVLANYLANKYNKTYDATSNKRFSLSEQTDKIVKGLKQDIKITYYDETSHFQQGKDLLQQYASLSSKVHVDYVDPFKKPQLARAAGIKNAGTAVVDMGPKHEEAKSFDEQGITGALVRIEKGGTRSICFVTGDGEHQIDDSDRNGFSTLKDTLQRDDYTSKSISLLQSATVPSDCTAVVIGGPLTDYVQPAVDALKKYVEGGGRAMFLLDPPLKLRRQDIGENKPLDDLLSSWGVTPDDDLVLDPNPIGQLAGLGPEVPLVTSYESHPIVQPMKGSATGFPITRSLQTKNTGKTTVEKLFSSSDNSFATSNLGPGEIQANPAKDKKGPFTLAAAGTYSTGKPNSEGRFVVVGSSGWAANSFLKFNGNRDLILNMMNWLSSDEDLISIRPKTPEDRRITLSRAQMSLVRSTSQFFLPLIVIIAGIMVWWRRR